MSVRCLILTVLTSLGACAPFVPPARGDLGFAATRVAPGRPEITATALTEGFSGQLAGTFAVAPRDTVETFAFDHGVPGTKESFLMVGAGYRRHLSDVAAPIQASLGFGFAGGMGGWNPGWQENAHHVPGALSGYVDLGVAWRTTDALTLFAATRFHRSVAFKVDGACKPHCDEVIGKDEKGQDIHDPDARLPPVTDWGHAGFGARYDFDPLYVTGDLGYAVSSNKVDENKGLKFGLSLGWRFGGGKR